VSLSISSFVVSVVHNNKCLSVEYVTNCCCFERYTQPLTRSTCACVMLFQISNHKQQQLTIKRCCCCVLSSSFISTICTSHSLHTYRRQCCLSLYVMSICSSSYTHGICTITITLHIITTHLALYEILPFIRINQICISI
jgi:hypothetical protein